LWILDTSQWTDWLSKKSRFLWIHGIPGAGKTVLASFLFQRLPYTCPAVYYYCYFGHNQNEASPFLRWILSQICRRIVQMPEILARLNHSGVAPRVSDILDALEHVLSLTDGAYVVLDAVDESLEPRTEMLNTIKVLATEPRFHKLQLLATSREYLDIETVLKDISTHIAMDVNFVEHDIRVYVRKELGSNRRISKWPDTLRDEVTEALAKGSKGM
jgi:Cdc6-like AAA superfamily ATPase